MPTSAELYEVGFAAFEAARVESRCELARVESRVSRLKLAATLETAGKMDEATQVLAQVNAEREAEGAV